MANSPNENAATLGLCKPLRFITDYNSAGKSVFSTVLDSAMTPMDVFNVTVHDAFISTRQPAQMNGGADLETMQSLPPAEGATVARVRAHLRELELVLDSGETRRLRPGDVVVQRGTNHAWRNTHPMETARAFFVMVPIVALVIDGEQFGENIEVSKEASL